MKRLALMLVLLTLLPCVVSMGKRTAAPSDEAESSSSGTKRGRTALASSSKGKSATTGKSAPSIATEKYPRGPHMAIQATVYCSYDMPSGSVRNGGTTTFTPTQEIVQDVRIRITENPNPKVRGAITLIHDMTDNLGQVSSANSLTLGGSELFAWITLENTHIGVGPVNDLINPKEYIVRPIAYDVVGTTVRVSYVLSESTTSDTQGQSTCKAFIAYMRVIRWCNSNLVGAKLVKPLRVGYPYGSTTAYDSLGRGIDCQRLDIYYDSIAYHEIGHAVMSATYESKLPATASRHDDCDQVEDPVTAFIEGYAQAFSAIARSMQNDPNAVVDISTPIDPEESILYIERYSCSDHHANTDEGRVAATIWDMYDTIDDTNGATLTFPQDGNGPPTVTASGDQDKGIDYPHDTNNANPMSMLDVLISPLMATTPVARPTTFREYKKNILEMHPAGEPKGDGLRNAIRFNWGTLDDAVYVSGKLCSANTGTCDIIVSWDVSPPAPSTCTLATSADGVTYTVDPGLTITGPGSKKFLEARGATRWVRVQCAAGAHTLQLPIPTMLPRDITPPIERPETRVYKQPFVTLNGPLPNRLPVPQSRR